MHGVVEPTLGGHSINLKTLKNNKASGPCNIPTELLKMSENEELSNVIHELVKRIRNN